MAQVFLPQIFDLFCVGLLIVIEQTWIKRLRLSCRFEVLRQLLAIFNAVGRVVWGFVSDHVGRTTAFVAMFVLQAGVMFVLAGLNTELSLAVGTSIVGFNFGGNFALFPSATADLFGARNLGVNYGWVFTAYGIAGVVGIAAGNAAKSMTGSYAAAFVVAGGLCLLSAVLAVGLKATCRRNEATQVA